MKDNSGASVQERVLDSGYFDALTLADLLGVIFRSRLTGTLQLIREGATLRIQCQEGIPSGVLGPASAALSVAATLMEVFQWSGGSFRLTEGLPATLKPMATATSVNLCPLIYEATGYFSAEQLKGLAFRLEGVVMPLASGRTTVPGLSLSAEEQQLLAQVDGRRTVGELLRSVPLEKGLGVRLLYALHSTEQGVGTVTSAKDLGRISSASHRRITASSSASTQVVVSPLGRADAARLLAAEGKFHRAKKLIAKKDFETAHARLVEATQLDAEEGDYRAYLGWTRFLVSPQDPMVVERALDDLTQALELNPKSDKAYLFRGSIHEARGDLSQAQTDYERALHCNADSHDALRALRRMNARVA